MTNPLHRSDTLDNQQLVGQQRPNSCIGIYRRVGRGEAVFPNKTTSTTTTLSSGLSSSVTVTSLHTLSRKMTSSRSGSRQHHRWMMSEPQERTPLRIVKRRNRSHSRRRMSSILRIWRVRDLLFLFGGCSRGDDDDDDRKIENSRWLASSLFNFLNFSSFYENYYFTFFCFFVIFLLLLIFFYLVFFNLGLF